MNVRTVLMLDSELDIENLYEVGDGIFDASDNMITFDGLTWRNARMREVEIVEARMRAESSEPVYAKKPVIDIPDVNYGLGYQGASVSKAGEDIYTDGLGKGFEL